jgi:hypothetical protein
MTRVPTISLLLLALSPAVSQAAVVPQKSIAGVKLGMSSTQVRSVLGEPKSDRTVPNEIQGRVRVLDYGLTDVTLGASSDTVQNVTTTSRRQRTSKDVGVGSLRATVAKKVPGAKCSREYGVAHCVVGQLRAGRTVTTFLLSKRNHVKRITLGYVID